MVLGQLNLMKSKWFMSISPKMLHVHYSSLAISSLTKFLPEVMVTGRSCIIVVGEQGSTPLDGIRLPLTRQVHRLQALPYFVFGTVVTKQLSSFS